MSLLKLIMFAVGSILIGIKYSEFVGKRKSDPRSIMTTANLVSLVVFGIYVFGRFTVDYWTM